ncbi:MAG: hypothetical protein FWE61_09640, partial [Micrococcales bacterium]|nr:hypothetical protein [Micrococcales bacterium]
MDYAQPSANPAFQRLVQDRYFYYDVAWGVATGAENGLDQNQMLANLWGVSAAEWDQVNAHYAQLQGQLDAQTASWFGMSRQGAWGRQIQAASGAPAPPQDVEFLDVPQLAAVETAAARFDWDGLLALLGSIPDPESLDYALSYIDEMPMLADAMPVVAAQHPQNPLAGTLAARALIGYAWDVRASWRADELTTSQWTTFHALATQAEQILTAVVAQHPGYLPALTSLLVAPVLRS